MSGWGVEVVPHSRGCSVKWQIAHEMPNRLSQDTFKKYRPSDWEPWQWNRTNTLRRHAVRKARGSVTGHGRRYRKASGGCLQETWGVTLAQA